MIGKSWVDGKELSEINRKPSPGQDIMSDHYAIAVNIYTHTQSLFFTNRSHFYPKECSQYVKRVSAHQK